MAVRRKGPRTLVVDLGGTGVKMMVLAPSGRVLVPRRRAPTPRPATPARVMRAVAHLASTMGPFERVAFGFPGVVEDGVARTAPNLADRSWRGVDVRALVRGALGRPVRVCNDADLQGFGVIEGRGVEMLITLGTGVGSALFVDGVLVPNLELGHHPWRRGRSYEDELRETEIARVGLVRWRRRVNAALRQVLAIWNPRLLHVGGGNARHLRPGDLPERARLVKGFAGIEGGLALWRGRRA